MMPRLALIALLAAAAAAQRPVDSDRVLTRLCGAALPPADWAPAVPAAPAPKLVTVGSLRHLVAAALARRRRRPSRPYDVAYRAAQGLMLAAAAYDYRATYRGMGAGGAEGAEAVWLFHVGPHDRVGVLAVGVGEDIAALAVAHWLSQRRGYLPHELAIVGLGAVAVTHLFGGASWGGARAR